MAITQPSQNAQQDDYPVAASLTVLVTRDADGDLQEGVRARLDAVECVASVDRVDVSGLRPALNDMRVDLDAALRVSGPPDAESVADALEAGFGVKEVREVSMA
ncbi:hypothetical protein C499_09694 [Halogeometricum borinquense DSM 11551]|uniref:Uncharacterized protein n=2 Tax=Halogeometricum borinquense TaxID=60847 RepID=E4NMM4_HALBP|nr:hypothetical protein [Halogeometricum borinquense]ADQ66179.1 hypothetical protein Hbor_05780 [Halogeometricum borinquense DSM 11551]ELY27326.1 hypothetical protein C499_09694 [Halogeometricum borinquense DSM 11551]RYJ14786.1 hypothetical protein ELS19_13040 [Halogeometricum borinquense]